jgi:integrase
MARETTGQVVERKGKRGITYAARVRAYGERHYLTLGYSWDGYTQRRAGTELQNILADIRRGTWKPPQPTPPPTPATDPTFHEFASQWLDGLRHELAPRTIEDYELGLTHHLLPFFKNHRLSQITAQETDRYKTAKVREREQGTVERPLSNRTINKTLTRLGQILDVAVRYELIPHNPVKGRVAKLKERPPTRARMQGHQVQVLLQHAGRHRALLATAIMAGGLRVSELINLRWQDIDLDDATLQVPVSKTEAGKRTVHLEPELVTLLREHKLASRWSQPEELRLPRPPPRSPP